MSHVTSQMSVMFGRLKRHLEQQRLQVASKDQVCRRRSDGCWQGVPGSWWIAGIWFFLWAEYPFSALWNFTLKLVKMLPSFLWQQK